MIGNFQLMSSWRLYLLILSATSIITFALSQSPMRPKRFGDGEYHKAAKSIATLDLDSVRFDKNVAPVLYYVPAYWLALHFGGDDTCYLVGVVFNVFVSSFAILMFNLGVRRLYSTPADWVITALLHILPLHAYYGLGIIAETLAFFSVAMIVLGYSHLAIHGCQVNNTLKNKGFWMLVVGIYLLVDSRLNYFAVLVVLFITWIACFRQRWRHCLLTVSLLLGLTLVMVGGSNYLASCIDGGRGRNFKVLVMKKLFMLGKYEFQKEPFNWTHWKKELKRDSVDYLALKNQQQSFKADCGPNYERCSLKFFAYWYFEYLSNNKISAVKQGALRMLHAYSLFNSSMLMRGVQRNWRFIVFHVAINIINYGFLVLFIYYLLYGNRISVRSLGMDKVVLVSLVLSSLPMICLFHSESRYFFPSRPAVMIGAAAVLGDIIQRYSILNPKGSY